MKRFGALLALAMLGTTFVGCGESGLKEGLPSEIPKSAQTDQFKETMKNTQEKMKMKKPKPGAAPAKPAS
ncbi:MAG: hypothetical protein ACLQGP_11585 [Isosphaeraceae bacterium]